ncbi:MAG: hypothetical protein K8S22_00780 [Betaproteobacteria bacterium]|nr:hypothetical protein [Betaproteobacteria bacterium]
MKQAIHIAQALQATGTCSPAIRRGSVMSLLNPDGRDTPAVRLVDAHMNLA